MTFKEYIVITFVAFLESLLLTSLVVCCIYLIGLNHNCAVHFCNINGISPDLTFTVFSAGLANNLTIVFILIETCLFFPIGNLLRKALIKINRLVTS